MLRALVLGTLLLTSVVACAREPASAPAADTAVTDPVAAPPAQPPAAPTENLDTAAQDTQETADTAEDPAAKGDAGLERLAALPAAEQLPAGKWTAGKNYTVLVPAQPTDAPAGKVEVVEVFWLGCGHCYALEPYVTNWLKKKADYIQFVRMPVAWGPGHLSHARLFYTLEALNRDDLVRKAFDEIHQRGNLLISQTNDDAESRRLQVAFAKANGITEADFLNAYNGMSVDANVQRSDQFTRRYRVTGVPMFVVAGKYTTDIAAAGGQTELFKLIDDLAASEKRR